MDQKDAAQSVYIACTTNNVALLVNVLTYSSGENNVACALTAAKLDNLEAFQVIGKYLSNSDWTLYERRQNNISGDFAPGNKCVAWAQEESKVRNADMESYSKESFIGKIIKFLKEDRTKALYGHPQYEKGEHSDILSDEHIESLNKKLNPSKVYIHQSHEGEGPTYYNVSVDKQVSENANKLVRLISSLSMDKIFSSASVNATMAFLNENYSKELYSKPELAMTKDTSQQTISSMRAEFLNRPKTTTDLRI